MVLFWLQIFIIPKSKRYKTEYGVTPYDQVRYDPKKEAEERIEKMAAQYD
jgi:hypothetical protein